MLLISKLVPIVAGISLLGGIGLYSANAAEISLDHNAPKSGSVTLNDHDKVVAASSPILYKAAKVKSNTPQLKTAVNLPNGRWVYYTDHNNYFNGYKVGHSNYLNHSKFHASYAKVGKHGSGRWVSAKANKWSISTSKGYGTFVAKYSHR